jgi:hypothetical protein
MKEPFMNLKLLSAIAFLAVTPALAQNQDAPLSKASKADVQKVIDSVKSDKGKMAQFCELKKIHAQYSTLTEKDEKKAEELDKAEEEATKKLGPDFEKIVGSELDDESAALLDGLANSCPK